MSPEFAKKWLKSAKPSSKSAKTHQICIEITKIYTKITENLLGFGRIWLNLTNMVEILLDLLGFELDLVGVGRICI